MAADTQSRIELAAGFVFVLSCAEVPGSIKIGSSSRDPGKYRYDTFGTFEPIPCKVEFSVHVPNRHDIEKNLGLKLAQRRLAQENGRFAVTADEAVATVVQLVGFDYTNAQITGVIFRNHVDMLKKMESVFRSRQKSFAILNGELADLQKAVRRHQRDLSEKTAAIERSEKMIAELRAENASFSRKWRRMRRAAVVAIGLAAAMAVATAAAYAGNFLA